MKGAAAALFLTLANPASADTPIDIMSGLYGDAADPELSCAANPHELSFVTSPPHAFLTWANPAPDDRGRMRRSERYDLLSVQEGELTLRLEGEARRTDTGDLPIWVMRFSPAGYCWRRTDWPVVRCERPQVRCESPVS